MKNPILVILCLISVLGFSNSIDSIKQEINKTFDLEKKIILNTELSEIYYQLNFLDSAIYYNTIAGNLAAKNVEFYPYKRANIFISRVLYLLKNQDFKTATKEALKLFKDTADASTFSNYNKMVLCEYYSVILTLENKPMEAIIPLQRALEIGKEIGAKLGNLYHNMGAIFYEISNYEKARTYFELAKKYDDVDSTIVNSSIVATYVEEKKIDEALNLLTSIVSEKDSVTEKNYKLFNILGDLYLTKKKYNKALTFLISSNEFMKQHNINIYDLVDNNSLLGDLYISKYEATKDISFLNKAKYYIESGLSGAKKTKRLASKIDLYFSLTKILIYQNKSEAAIKSFNTFRAAQDSLYQLETSSIVEELDVKYQVSEKQKKIAILKTEKIETELQHKKNSNTFVLIISLIIILSLNLLFLYLNAQSKKKSIEQKLQIESLKKQELKSQLILKENELNNNISLISEKNKLIKSLREQSNKTNSNLDSIIEKFEQNYISDKEWSDIQLQFDSLNNGLIDKIQKETGNLLTPNDIKLFILLKLQYSNNSMADILNISYEGVKKAKQRLNKKIDLDSIFA